jgi:hypothetical protein
MTFWGHGAGLSIGTIQKAIQANLFKNIGRRNPILRFSISQGPDPRDPVMIKVPHPAGSWAPRCLLSHPSLFPLLW